MSVIKNLVSGRTASSSGSTASDSAFLHLTEEVTEIKDKVDLILEKTNFIMELLQENGTHSLQSGHKRKREDGEKAEYLDFLEDLTIHFGQWPATVTATKTLDEREGLLGKVRCVHYIHSEFQILLSSFLYQLNFRNAIKNLSQVDHHCTPEEAELLKEFRNILLAKRGQRKKGDILTEGMKQSEEKRKALTNMVSEILSFPPLSRDATNSLNSIAEVINMWDKVEKKPIEVAQLLVEMATILQNILYFGDQSDEWLEFDFAKDYMIKDRYGQVLPNKLQSSEAFVSLKGTY
jgi:hypothetical protein